MGWIIFAICLFLFLMYIDKRSVENEKKQKEIDNNLDNNLIEMGYSIQLKIHTGKYFSGHPDINTPVEKTIIYPIDGILAIMNATSYNTAPVKIAEINNSFIKNVQVLDKTSIENKVTLGRVLLTGVFALAWKKKKVNEAAYLTIEWNDGRFDHETIFEYEGKGSMQAANTARNKIIQVIR